MVTRAKHLHVVADRIHLGLNALLPEVDRGRHAALLMPIGHRPERLGVDVRDEVEPFPSGPGEGALDVPVHRKGQPKPDVAAESLLVAPVQIVRPGQSPAIVAFVVHEVAGDGLAELVAQPTGVGLERRLDEGRSQAGVEIIDLPAVHAGMAVEVERIDPPRALGRGLPDEGRSGPDRPERLTADQGGDVDDPVQDITPWPAVSLSNFLGGSPAFWGVEIRLLPANRRLERALSMTCRKRLRSLGRLPA